MNNELELILSDSWDLLQESYNDLFGRVLDKKSDTRKDTDYPVIFEDEDGVGVLTEESDQDEDPDAQDITGDEFHQAGFHEYDVSKKSDDLEFPQPDDTEDIPPDPNLLQKPPSSGIVMGPDHWIVLEHILSNIDSAISSRDPIQLVSLFGQAEEQCHSLDIDSGFDIDEIRDLSKLLRIKSGELLYSPPKPTLIVPKLIIPTEQYLVSLIKNNPESLFSISPRQFEELIAELFNHFGFHVELQKATRDGGRDIVAINETIDIKTKYLIECKRYAPNNKVSVSIVQRLYGVKMAEAANKGILVTTSSYTRDAREFASKHIWDLDLKAYDDIVAWVGHYKYPSSSFSR